MAALPSAAMRLLNEVPESARSAVLRQLTSDLKTRYDDNSARLAIALIEDQPISQPGTILIDALVEHARRGVPIDVASALRQSPLLREAFFDRLVAHLTLLTGHSVNHVSSVSKDSMEESSSTTATTLQKSPDDLLQLLFLITSLLSEGVRNRSEIELMRAGLKLMGFVKHDIALAASRVVFMLLRLPLDAVRISAQLRECVRSLLSTADSRFHQTLGYSLWLRRVMSPQLESATLSDFQSTEYWREVKHGLRHGDSERRKLCLEILQQSVRIAIQHNEANLVTESEDVSHTVILSQYSRFCTVFETVALIRYTNLVVECERDLQLLASSQSVIDVEWLFVLIASALDPQLQDQNRKYIGNWILNSDLTARAPCKAFIKLLLEDFLPWATEGHLFVATLKPSDDGFRCYHGERLSDFIARAINDKREDEWDRTLLVDTLLDFLLQRRSKLFAYASVYIIDGLSKAVMQDQTMLLSPKQIQLSMELSKWRALPESARVFIIDRCNKLRHFSRTRTNTASSTGPEDASVSTNPSILETTETIEPPALNTTAETTLSGRDHKIERVTQDCHSLRQALSANSPDISSVTTKLEDIWSEVEYLEYPRELLMLVPQTFICPETLRLVVKEDTANQALSSLLASTVRRLLELTERRSFLLSHVIAALRRTILLVPETTSLLPVDDFILQIANSPPEPTIELRFEYATLRLLDNTTPTQHDQFLEQHFGHRESHGFATYLDLINRLNTHHDLLKAVISSLMGRWKRQKVPVPTISLWKTTLQLQVLVSCCEQFATFASSAEIKQTLEDLLHINSIEPLPRYRHLLQWAVLRLLVHQPAQRMRLLDLMSTKDHHSNPKYLASLMKVSVELASVEDTSEDFATSLAATFIALSASSKIVIRHEAQWSFPFLMDLAKHRNWRGITENPAYVALDTYIRSLPRYDEPPVERTLSKFDPVQDHTLTNLAEGLWTDLDSIRPPFARRGDFLAIYEQDEKAAAMSQIPASCMPLGSAIPRRPREEQSLKANEPAKETTKPKQMSPEEAIALQTKGNAYLRNTLQGIEAERARSGDLAVVASLIENPYNLGGLSRVSEIFGASALYVRDPRVIAEKDFTSVSVSSHNHIDILPLSLPDMPAFLASKRLERWAVVGIEQTDRSVVLGTEQCALPKKSILVLGSEKGGMPGTVLSECDILVEIPQQGVTRSLNVQTAGAIALFEYNKQHGA